MVPLDRAMTNLYTLSILIVTMLCLQRFGRNFECNVAVFSRQPRAPNYYIVS